MRWYVAKVIQASDFSGLIMNLPKEKQLPKKEVACIMSKPGDVENLQILQN